MTVRQLIEQLSECEQDAQVIVAADEEGNGFKKLYAVEGHSVFIEDGAFGDYVTEKGSEDDTGEGINCIVLWP
jgi:topoisomerase IA-like protein